MVRGGVVRGGEGRDGDEREGEGWVWDRTRCQTGLHLRGMKLSRIHKNCESLTPRKYVKAYTVFHQLTLFLQMNITTRTNACQERRTTQTHTVNLYIHTCTHVYVCVCVSRY